MIREIQIPQDIAKLSKAQLEIAVNNNDDILLSHCKSKKPKYGVVTFYGLLWNNYQEFQKDAEETCHYFYQLLVIYQQNKVIAPSHADEIYNQKINPYTSQPLS